MGLMVQMVFMLLMGIVGGNSLRWFRRRRGRGSKLKSLNEKKAKSKKQIKSSNPIENKKHSSHYFKLIN
jgi:hypothetical protein